MKKLILILMASVGCCSVVLFGLERSSDLSLDIKADQSSYLIGEAVNIGLILKNRSSVLHSLPLAGPLTVEAGNFRIWISDSTQEHMYNGPNWDSEDGQSVGLTLSPLQTARVPVKLLYDSTGGGTLAFSRPGTYYLKAEFTGLTDRTIVSVPIAVNILPPRPQDEDLVSVLRTNPDLLFLMHTGAWRDGSRQRQEHIIQGLLQSLRKGQVSSEYRDQVERAYQVSGSSQRRSEQQ